MPVYEYLCDSCGSRFEALQRMMDDPLTECTSCKGAVHRVIQPVGIIFKGSGFYATDSRKSSSSSVSSSDKSTSETKADSKSDSSSDSSASSTSSGESKAPAATAASGE